MEDTGNMIEFCDQVLTPSFTSHIISQLAADNTTILSLRGCEVENEDLFDDLLAAVISKESLMQLNVNLGLISSPARAAKLGHVLLFTPHLESLLLHGSNLGLLGMDFLHPGLSSLRHMTSLDLGDCGLNDRAVLHVAEYLCPRQGYTGLSELALSANADVTPLGWVRLLAATSLAALRTLQLDYNWLGDFAAAAAAVLLARNTTLETLDLEETGITDRGAKLLLYVLENHPTNLKRLVLHNNRIRPENLQAIHWSLRSDESDPTSGSDLQDESSFSSSDTEGANSDVIPEESEEDGEETSSGSEIKTSAKKAQDRDRLIQELGTRQQGTEEGSNHTPSSIRAVEKRYEKLLGSGTGSFPSFFALLSPPGGGAVGVAPSSPVLTHVGRKTLVTVGNIEDGAEVEETVMSPSVETEQETMTSVEPAASASLTGADPQWRASVTSARPYSASELSSTQERDMHAFLAQMEHTFN